MLNRVEPRLLRGVSHLPHVKLGPATKTLHLDVAFSSGSSAKYHAQLELEGNVVWSNDDPNANTVPGGAILKVDILAAPLSPGTRALTITIPAERNVSYWVQVSTLP